MQLIKKDNFVYWGIIFFFFVEMTNELDYFFKINLPLVRYTLGLIGSFYILKGTYFSNNKILDDYSFFVKLVVYFLSIYTFVIIIQDLPIIFSPNQSFINLKKSLSGYISVYFIPFIVYWRLNLFELRKITLFTEKIGIFYVSISLLFFPFFINPVLNEYGYAGEAVGAVFGSAMALILLTFPYHSNKTVIIGLFSILFGLVINGILARRNQVAYFASILLFTLLINVIFKPRGIRINKFLINISIFVFLVLSIVLFFNFQSLFVTLFERVDEGFSSRETVLEEFIDDFDSKPLDWYTGRGLFGTFKSLSLGAGEDMSTRDGIENGYYYLILKGGYFYLGSFIILSIISIFNGLINSKNLLSKAFACLVITQYIEMFGFGLPSLTIKYFIFWIAVTAGLSPHIYNKSDLEIYSVFKFIK